MSVANEIIRIKKNISDSYIEAEKKGAILPTVRDSNNLAATLATITGGGGGDTPSTTEWEFKVESITNEDGNTQTLVIFHKDYQSGDASTPTISRTFSENSPETISYVGDEIARNGYTSSQVEEIYGWKIGDTTSYTLTTGENVEMRIIGFNHDDLADGSGKAGITLEMTNCLATKYPMNNTRTNAGGYPATVLRNTTLPQIKATLPQEWQDIIKLVNKKSANGGAHNYTETITTSEDLFLLSEIELFGTANNSKDGANEGAVYEYWSSNPSRVKKYDTTGDGTIDTAFVWWLRSCSNYWLGSDDYFVVVNGSGFAGNDTAYLEYPMCVSYAFCVGGGSSGGGDTPETPDTPTLEFSRTFSENTPAQISAVSAEISANNMTSSQVAETYGWNIGDTTSYQLTTGENVEMRIIGFNHDDLADGSGKAGITLEMTNCLATTYSMNATATNSGGWESSVMRTTTLPAIKATLPQAWQDAIVTVSKKASKGSGTAVTTTSDELFLLSILELGGGTYGVQSGVNEGATYEYWANATDYYKWLKKVDGSSSNWLARSSDSNSTSYFYGINSDGRNSRTWFASTPTGTSYAFCV